MFTKQLLLHDTTGLYMYANNGIKLLLHSDTCDKMDPGRAIQHVYIIRLPCLALLRAVLHDIKLYEALYYTHTNCSTVTPL